MSTRQAPTLPELAELDRFYREGGLRRMASPHVHYQEPGCPHPECPQLVRAWWDGTGFAGRCPHCGGWIHLTTLGMEALTEEQAIHLPRLPDNWHTVAQVA